MELFLSALAMPPQAVDMQQIFETCPAGRFMDCVQDAFLFTTEQWLGRTLLLTQRLFLILAALELAVSGWVYWTRRSAHGSGDVIGTLAVKLGAMAFILGLITTVPYWAPQVPYYLASLAIDVGGADIADLSITGIVSIGWRLSWSIFVPLLAPLTGIAAGGGLLAGLLHFGIRRLITGAAMASTSGLVAVGVMTAVMLALAIVIFVCYVSIAVQLLTTIVESYVVISAGFLFVGAAAFRGTAPFTSAYVRYLVYIGVKLFVLLLICGAVTVIASALADLVMSPAGGPAFADANAITSALGMVVAIAAISLLLMELARRVPEELAQRVSQGVTVDIKGLLSRS